MTKQQLFDRVAKHLLKQRERAEGADGNCLYYDNVTGRKCAIGCLIPAKKYREEFEGDGISNPLILEAAGLNVRLLPLAVILQGVHDGQEPEDWQECLDDVAVGAGLRPWPRNKRSQ